MGVRNAPNYSKPGSPRSLRRGNEPSPALGWALSPRYSQRAHYSRQCRSVSKTIRCVFRTLSQREPDLRDPDGDLQQLSKKAEPRSSRCQPLSTKDAVFSCNGRVAFRADDVDHQVRTDLHKSVDQRFSPEMTKVPAREVVTEAMELQIPSFDSASVIGRLVVVQTVCSTQTNRERTTYE